MKNLKYLSAIAVLALLFGCNQGQPKSALVINTSNLKPGKYRYTAVFDKDTANLKMDIAVSGKITGNLTIRFTKPNQIKAELDTGDINGEFRGDTLFADYNFKSIWKFTNGYTNPVVLLHKGDMLIMGSGRIMNYLGRSYFDPGTISFDKSKFRFLQVKDVH